MRQYIITGMNGSHGYSQVQYGPWCQSIHQGYPYHSIWHPSHFYIPDITLLLHCKEGFKMEKRMLQRTCVFICS